MPEVLSKINRPVVKITVEVVPLLKQLENKEQKIIETGTTLTVSFTFKLAPNTRNRHYTQHTLHKFILAFLYYYHHFLYSDKIKHLIAFSAMMMATVRL